MKRVLGVIAIALIACAPSQGTVIAKDFEPAHTELRMQYMRIGDTTMMIPVQDYYPDYWSVRLRNCTQESKCKTGWRQVTQDSYDRINVGDWVNVETGDIVEPVKSEYVQTVPPKGAKVVDKDWRPGE